MAYDNARKQYSKEHLWYIEIEVNGTTHRFCENRSPLPVGLEAIPTLRSVRVNPAEIDLNGGLGVRAKASVTLSESMDYTEWGTVTEPVRFWSRWRAENPYYLGYRLSVFSGYIVNDTFAADNFTRRDYIIESFAQTGSGVSITAKDPLKLASNDRAKAPVESRGSLTSDITEAATSFTLQPIGVGDSEYPLTGYVRIGDEVIQYAARTGDSFSGLTRGAYNTVASEHSQDDAAQLCLRYDAETVSNISYDLLVNYAGVDASYINKGEWDAEVSTAFTVTYSTLITEPTGVQDLLKEFAQSAPHYLFWDERVNQIRLRSLRPPPEDAPLLTWQGNLLKNSSSVKDMQSMRVSTVIVNYGIFDPTKDLDETSNYRGSYVREDSASVTNYGQRAYRKVNSRWISSDNKAGAILMSARIGRRFASAPRMVGFKLDAKDADVWTGDAVKIETDLIEQAGGGYPQLNYQIISAGESANFDYTALEHTYGDAVAGDEDVEDPNTRLIYIAGNQDQLGDPVSGAPRTLREVYEAVYGSDPLDAGLDIRFIFESNAVAGSSDNTQYAIETGAWSELTTPILIINNGLIVGAGGKGADSFADNAENGGPAILLQADIRLDNNNIIGGGGGGGARATDGGAIAAGGGGAGYFNGVAGTGTAYLPQEDEIEVNQADSGTNTTGGAGGLSRGSTTGEFYISVGGFGGSLGVNGGVGSSSNTSGLAGKAIELNGFTVTYINTGTILGVVS